MDILVNRWDRLRSKLTIYKDLIKSHQDRWGFVETDHCDATLWSGLLGASGVEVQLYRATDPRRPGRWYRRSVDYPECWECAKSRSTISKDMLLGVMYWAVATKKLHILEDLWNYGNSRSWVMGSGRYDGIDSLMNPLWISTLAQAIYVLGGADHSWWRSVKPYYAKADGFAAHLNVLIILLRKDLGLYGKAEQEILEYHKKRQPKNALFQLAAGNVEVAETLLLNEKWWPADRLPTSYDRSESWLFQRDYGSDWKPDDSSVVVEHSGADFIFAANLLLSKHK